LERITIFTTDETASRFEPFEHGDAVFEFARLASDGPTKLVDGTPWVFVDWVLDDLSGLEMCRRLRADRRMSEAHITLVLDEDDAEDRRRAIKAGADDYCIGPPDRQTMLDRVLALHANQPRQNMGTALEFGETGELQINVAGEQARWKGQQIALRPNEFRLLRFMAENPNRVLSRPELIGALGKAGDPDYLRTVDVWVKRLRAGLRNAGAGDLLRTVHGKGYVLDL